MILLTQYCEKSHGTAVGFSCECGNWTDNISKMNGRISLIVTNITLLFKTRRKESTVSIYIFLCHISYCISYCIHYSYCILYFVFHISYSYSYVLRYLRMSYGNVLMYFMYVYGSSSRSRGEKAGEKSCVKLQSKFDEIIKVSRRSH